jgi:hypothetical protein
MIKLTKQQQEVINKYQDKGWKFGEIESYEERYDVLEDEFYTKYLIHAYSPKIKDTITLYVNFVYNIAEHEIDLAEGKYENQMLTEENLLEKELNHIINKIIKKNKITPFSLENEVFNKVKEYVNNSSNIDMDNISIESCFKITS